MPFQYKQVLMVGATSGIGAALADRLVLEGTKVIAVGRRQDRLDAFVTKHGKDKTSAIKFDINDKQGTDHFVSQVTTEYPDLDCIWLNAGVQIRHNLSEPAKIDMNTFHGQVETNFSRVVDLTVKFLPLLLEKKSQTSFIYTTSNLAWVPCTGIAAYSASKHALNAFLFCLRHELRESNVKVIEVSPPAVQTELHDYMGSEGRKIGMPLDKFTDETWKGLESGTDQVIVGSIGQDERFNDIVNKRRAAFEDLAKVMTAAK